MTEGEPTVIMRGPRLELEAAANGQVELNALSVPYSLLGHKPCDVGEERCVRLQVCGVGVLGPSARAMSFPLHIDFVERG